LTQFKAAWAGAADHGDTMEPRRATALHCLLASAAAALGTATAHAAPPTPAVTPERATALVRMVRQDCGACHGMQLTGGLGPALTPAALADKPLDSMTAVIFGGRPGTPMPPWRGLLTETEARWIAEALARGLPEEKRNTP
jgi:cytochrome c55X